jgi:hypothetical protein
MFFSVAVEFGDDVICNPIAIPILLVLLLFL